MISRAKDAEGLRRGPHRSGIAHSLDAWTMTARAALCAAIAGVMLLSAGPPARAHDFGGDTTGSNEIPPPPPPPPCDDACGCEGPGGGGGGSGGGGGDGGGDSSPPPNRSPSPISFWNGGESITETDLVVSGVLPIRLIRKYDSLSTYDSPLGYGWSFAHDRRLYEYPDGSIVIRYGCGTRDRYVSSGGAYVSPAGGMLATLVHQSDGSWEVRYLNGNRDLFDSMGRLTVFQDARGNRHEFTYDPAGKLPLTGTSKAAVTPGAPTVVAYNYRLTRIEERGADGALTSRAVNFVYNATTGRLTSATANDGRSVSYAHDTTASLSKGNLVQVNGLESIVRVYGYTDTRDEHNLTSITQGVGRTPIVNTYDDQDRVIRQEEGTRRTDFNYSVPLTKTIVTLTVRDQNGLNPYTAVTTYDFDTTGRITKLTDALGHEQRYIYTANKQLERKEIWQNTGGTLSLLKAMSWTYDTSGHRLTETVTLDSGEIITRSWTYDHDWVASEQAVSSTAPAKIFRTEHTFFYDGDGLPISIREQKRRKDDGSFQVTSYIYDGRNRLLTTTFADGTQLVNEYTGDYVSRRYFLVGGSAIPQKQHRFEYDAEGNLTKEWDGRNNLTQYGYDDRKRLTSVTNALGEQAIYVYTNDLLTQTEVGRTAADGEGRVTRLIYDARARLTGLQRKDDAGVFQALETYELDSEGQQLAVVDAIGRRTTYTYDKLGRATSTSDALSNVTQAGYDAADNRISATDALGRVTQYEYDDLNRITARVDLGASASDRTEYTYDAASNVLTVRDPEGHTTTYEHDALSRNTRITQPLGQSVEYAYDSLDRVDYFITARSQKVDFAYEAWGPVKEEKQYPTASAATANRTIAYQYDNEGNLTGVMDDGVQIGSIYSITYDALNRAFDETAQYLPGGDKVLRHRYDRYGNSRQMSLDDGATATDTYTYNKLNQLASASLSGAPIGLTHYANDDRQVVTLPGNVSRTYTYKANGPIDAISVAGPSGTIAQLSYAYDAVLNVDTMTDADGVHDYGYDGLDRLTSALRPAVASLPNESYAYDRAGNREDPGNGAAYVYDANNRITAGAGRTYTFDADGNLHTRSDGAVLTHDPVNRLTHFSRGATSSEYVHDSFGRRIKKTVNGATTFYLWDDESLVAEYDDSGLRTKRYAYLEGDRVPAQITDASGTYYVHEDQIGAPRLATSTTAQVVWSARYESFGKAVVNEDPDGNGIALRFNARLPGQYLDAESGLHYNFRREYDPDTGRYIEPDPYGQSDEQNLYQYAYNNPTGNTDPTGEIVPAAIAYARCVAQCMAMEAIESQLPGGSGCFDWQDAAADCALDCLNPFKWFKFDKVADLVKRVPAKTLRKNWEKYYGKKWPKQPGTDKPKVAHHKRPLADGGSNHPKNIEPMTPKQHRKHHADRGDPGRWAKRRRK